MNITLVNYGLGNLHSQENAFRSIGIEVTTTGNPDLVRNATHLVLPGVGAFGDGMRRIHAAGLDVALHDAVQRGAYLLGVCLGMQLLLESSEEFGQHIGLAFLPGEVKYLRSLKGFDPEAKVPHVGWATLVAAGSHPIARASAGEDMYFVHSLASWVADEEDIWARAHYGGIDFPAVVGRGKIVGCQFHPEKSGPDGLAWLKSFLDWSGANRA